MEKKLLIIDGNAILHRAFHAIPDLTTPSGQPINAVYGLVSMLLNLVENLRPTDIVVCFDEKEKTFRHKEFKEYQSQRPPVHEDLSSQFKLSRDFLKSAKIPVYSKPGYEADDLIGTISKKTKMDKVVIVTGDKDILQLANEKVNLFMPQRGLSNGKLYGIEETIERLGVKPSQIVDYKGLVGDPSDNYKGVAGIGPKTATGLLEEFGTFKNIYKNLNKIPEKTREKLEKGKESADMSYKLARIITDVPVKFDFQIMEGWDLGSAQVLKLFEEFGFKTLTKRIMAFNKKREEEKQTSLF